MRIVLTVHQFLPDYRAGTEILTYDTARALQGRGHDVAVVTAYPASVVLQDQERFDDYEYDGIPVHRFRYNFLPMGDQNNVFELEYNNLFFKRNLQEYLHRSRPDVLHSFHLARLSASVIDACGEEGVPMVMTPTDFWLVCPTYQLRWPGDLPCDGPEWTALNCLSHLTAVTVSPDARVPLSRYPRWVRPLALFAIKYAPFQLSVGREQVRAVARRQGFLRRRMRRIDKLIVPTSFMMSLLTKNGLDARRAVQLPFGINLQNVSGAPRPQPSATLRLGFIGTLFEHKGIQIVAQAVRAMPERPIELEIYGRLDEFPEFRATLLAIIGDDPRIKLCGSFPNERIGEILSRFDALVVPSIWRENTPLVLYSAQAAGCPVLGSDVAGISEVIEHGKNGLLFRPGDVSDLVRTLETVLRDRELLPKLSAASKPPLSIEDYAEELEKIYIGLVGKRRVT